MQIYLLIADDRQGPFTPEQITEKIQAGECTAETLAWKDGMEEWKPLADVCPQPAAPPPLPETPVTKPATVAGGKNGFSDFFRAYRGLFQRIKISPLPQPAQWFDRYPIIFPAAFLAFFFFGLGLIPLLLTSRLSGGDKGRVSLISAWPLYLAMLPVVAPLVIVVLFLLPIIFLPLMWFKKWFTPQMRYAISAVLGGGFVALVALTVFLNAKQRGEAKDLFKSEPEQVLARVKSATNNILFNPFATNDGEDLIRRFEHIEHAELSEELKKLRSALDSAKTKRKESEEARRPVAQGEKASESKEELPVGIYLTNPGYLAGISKEAMDNAARYQVAEDAEALALLMDSGAVVRLKPGLKVELIETHVFSGLVEIRPIGSTIQLWTNSEAISR
jgi:hypothetical protein